MSDIIEVFKSKTTNGNRNSRYRKLDRLLNDDDEEYIETTEAVDIPTNNTDSYHIVTQKDANRLDLIAYHYYHNSLLWWVIAEASGIIDPFNVPINTVLRIPDKGTIYGMNNLVS